MEGGECRATDADQTAREQRLLHSQSKPQRHSHLHTLRPRDLKTSNLPSDCVRSRVPRSPAQPLTSSRSSIPAADYGVSQVTLVKEVSAILAASRSLTLAGLKTSCKTAFSLRRREGDFSLILCGVDAGVLVVTEDLLPGARLESRREGGVSQESEKEEEANRIKRS